MRTFQEEDKIKLLADIIEIQSENENEIEVCHYIQNLLAQYDIPSKIIKVSETRANLVVNWEWFANISDEWPYGRS